MKSQRVALSLMILGPEGSGKTTLVQQLRCISRENSLLSTPVDVSPSTGQETEVIPLAAPMQDTAALEGMTKKAESQGMGRLHPIPGGNGGTNDSNNTATNNNENKTPVVSVKEIGGSMMAMWNKFLDKMLTSAPLGMQSPEDAPCALMFVVDCSSPHQIPHAAVELSSLFSRGCYAAQQQRRKTRQALREGEGGGGGAENADDTAVAVDAASLRLHKSAVAIVLNKTQSSNTVDTDVLKELIQLPSLFAMRRTEDDKEEHFFTTEVNAQKKRVAGGGVEAPDATQSGSVSVFETDGWNGNGLLDLWEWLCEVAALD